MIIKTKLNGALFAAVFAVAARPVAAPAEEAGLPAFPGLQTFLAALAQAPSVPAVQPMVGSRSDAKAAAVSELPASFSVYGRFFAWTDTFDIKSGQATLGTVTQKFISLTKSFTYIDAKNNKVAEARARFFALGSTVDVTDGGGRKIGTIKEDILKSLFKVYTLYKILDANGKEIATSEKVQWLSTEIILRDPAGRVIAEVRRGFKQNLFRLTDRWDVNIHDAQAVDSRLIVLIAAYKSSVDNDRRNEKDD